MIRRIKFEAFKSLAKQSFEPGSVNLLIGANAAGKSNVIRAFRFLADAVRSDVETAAGALGGLENAVFWAARKQRFALSVEYFVPDLSAPHSKADMSYRIEIGDHGGRPAVLAEELRLKVKRDVRGRSTIWLTAHLGQGEAIRDPESPQREPFDTGDPGVLALKALGFLATYPRIRALRTFIEGWQFLAVNLDAVRAPRRDVRATSLEIDGSNLVNVLRTIRGADAYGAILGDLKQLVDTVEDVDTSVDRGRVLLQLKERPFLDPAEALSVSDGTLRLLAILTAVHLMPEHGLLCIEEPEHGLHPLVFGPLLDLVRERCPSGGSRQVVVTTHSPDLVDAAAPNEVVTVDRDDDGSTTLSRPGSPELATWLEDFRLGELWRMRQIGGVPR